MSTCMNSVKEALNKLPYGATVHSSEVISNLADKYHAMTVHKSLQRLKDSGFLLPIKQGEFKIIGEMPLKTNNSVKSIETEIKPYDIVVDTSVPVINQIREVLSNFDSTVSVQIVRLHKTLNHLELTSLKANLSRLASRGEVVTSGPGFIKVIGISKVDKKKPRYNKEYLPRSDFKSIMGKTNSLFTYDNPTTFQSQDYDLVEFLSKLSSKRQLHLVEMEQYLESVNQLNVLLHNKFLTYTGRGNFFLNYIPREDQLGRLRRAAIEQSNLVDEDD